MNFSDSNKKTVVIFGDSNTYGYNPETEGRYPESYRYPYVLQELLGKEWEVISQGLNGRTSVFEDPLDEGLSGITYISPCLKTDKPIDKLIIMLGTNDSQERFNVGAVHIAEGIVNLAEKAAQTPCWRKDPDILILCPPPIKDNYRELKFGLEMGEACDVKTAQLAYFLETMAIEGRFSFLDAGLVPGVEMHPLDGMHLTAESHVALAQFLLK
ncbi:MAG TPA: GDSL-type esterase/lipase family protein, partial [Clostridia bacterium]|nr:GDSL-type esterase/lipase family protein [Clostridia bacterium]